MLCVKPKCYVSNDLVNQEYATDRLYRKHFIAGLNRFREQSLRFVAAFIHNYASRASAYEDCGALPSGCQTFPYPVMEMVVRNPKASRIGHKTDHLYS